MAVQSKEMVLPPWGGAVAGAAGGVLANTLVYPLDLIKTKLQVQTKTAPGAALPAHHYASTWDAVAKIVAAEGPAGLYAGMTGCLIGVASQQFAYHYWYTLVRSAWLARATTGPPGTPVELALGAVAGMLASIFTIPVAVVTTRQQTVPREERKSLLGTAREVVEGEDGWKGLWRGLRASLVLCINPSITYGATQRLRVLLFKGKKTLSPYEAFLLGAMSKALATLCTQPLIVAKVGLQSKPPPERQGRNFKTFGEVMRHIVEHEGVMRLFKGVGPQLLKGILVQGILNMTKERIEIYVLLLLRYVRKLRAEQLATLASKLPSIPIPSPAILK